MRFNYCMSCGEEVIKTARFCPHCRYPFTKEAEAILASKNKIRPKVSIPEPEDEDDNEDDNEEVEETEFENSSVGSINELGGLEIEGLYQDKPQKISFEALIHAPKDTTFKPRQLQKVNKRTFEKQWQAEAGNSRKTEEE